MLKPPTDKPSSLVHEHRGVRLRIAFRYNHDSDVPTGVVISPEKQPDPSALGHQDIVVYDLFEGQWSSYWEAADAGAARAEAFIDANWEDE